MTTTEIQRLINVAGSAISESTPRLSEESSRLAGSSINQLLELLWARNGFYAFESALHVYGVSEEPGAMGLDASQRLGRFDGVRIFADWDNQRRVTKIPSSYGISDD